MQVLRPPSKSRGVAEVVLAELARILPQAFLIGMVLLFINEGAFIAGLPAWQSAASFGKYPIGATGLIISSWVAAAVCGLALLVRSPQPRVLQLCLAVIALLGPGVLSLSLHGGTGVAKSLALLVTSVGVVVSASLAGPRFVGGLAFVAGGLVAWISLILGFVSLAGAGSLKALEVDTSGRYGRWLGPLSGILDVDRLGALIGIAGGRQTLGPVMATLLVVHVVLILRLRLHHRRRWVLLVPLGSALGLLWSMSRTGMVAAVGGIFLALLPWNRLREAWAVAVLAGLTLLTWGLPVLSSVSSNGSPGSEGTFAWRRSLWGAYLEDDSFFSTVGIGAQAPPPIGAGHAHNLLVESVANGGQLGLLGLVVFVFVAVYVSVQARSPLQSVAVGVWGVFMVAGTLEMPVTVRLISFSMLWFMVLCALGVAASHPRTQSSLQKPAE